ncbi:hypothetical protein D3C71_2186210 [compost metagenome]
MHEAMACSTSSATRLLAPITFVGRTALSVETRTKFSTPLAMAARTMFSVPKTLLRMPSPALASTMGTCL